MEAQGLRKTDRVVRPIAAAGGRTCARPGCPAPAQATLVFAYDEKQARLTGLLPERDPASYDLCTGHAERTSPPFGWTLTDERPPDDDAPVDLSDEDRTVAVISAALRAVPSAPDRSAPAPHDDHGDTTSTPDTRAPRPVLAARDDDEVQALSQAAEALADAEVEVALDELRGLADEHQDQHQDEPETADVATMTLTLPFEPDADTSDGLDDVVALDDAFEVDLDVDLEVGLDLDVDVDLDEDAPLTPEGHAQIW